MNIRRLQFSLASLLSAVLLIAVACVALRYASEFWASLAFTLTVSLLFGATLGLVFRGGVLGAFCLGFALCGWGYLFLVFGPRFRGKSSPQPPDLLTTRLLAYVHPKLAETLPGSGPFFKFVDYGQYPISVSSWDHFQQVGHSLVTLLVALVGGGLARYLHARPG